MFDWIKKRLEQYRIGLTCLFLTAFVAGCGTIEVRATLPPQVLLQTCITPADIQARHALQTNAGILPYVRDLKAALLACGADKDALREWAKEVQDGAL